MCMIHLNAQKSVLLDVHSSIAILKFDSIIILNLLIEINVKV